MASAMLSLSTNVCVWWVAGCMMANHYTKHMAECLSDNPLLTWPSLTSSHGMPAAGRHGEGKGGGHWDSGIACLALWQAGGSIPAWLG